MLTSSVEIDNLPAVNVAAYDWVFGFHSDPPVPLTHPQRRSKHRHGKPAGTYEKETASRYWPSEQSSVLRVQRPPIDYSLTEETRAWLKFKELVAQWRAERGATSSIAEMCSTPAYLSILAMGKEAIPLLLGQLRLEGDDPDHWFVALYHTAEVDPIPDQDKGDMAKMSEAWLKWAEQEHNAW